jgi:hypothetical protein
MRLTVAERLERFSIPEPNSGCYLWLGALDKDGYAWMGGINARAARKAYEEKNGRIPDGFVLDHRCRLRCCVNPDHLEAVTQKVNWDRGDGPVDILRQRKFVCDECGGPWEILRTTKDGGPMRGCRACTAAYMKDYHERNRDKHNAQMRRNYRRRRDA